jgi:hypothetical protein
MSSKINIEKIVYDPSEEHMGTLGVDYVSNFLISGDLSKTILVLTDKRLYQKGKAFERNSSNGFSQVNTQKVVDIKDITGTSLINYKPLLLKIVLLFLIAMFSISSISSLGLLFSSEMGLKAFIPLLLNISITYVLYWFYKKIDKRFFVVEYAGGSIATDSSLYKESEINEFQKLISNLKDSHFKNISKSNNQNEKDLINVSGINVKSKEDRLIELNALYEKQLISNDEYNELKKNIILGN